MGDPAWEVNWEDTGWVRSGFCGLAWTLALQPLGNSGFQGLPLELWGKAWLSCPTWPAPHLPFYFQARSPSGCSQPWRELKKWGEEGALRGCRVRGADTGVDNAGRKDSRRG